MRTKVRIGTHVLRIPPLFKMFNAIPSEVGPNTAPAAMIDLVSSTFIAQVRSMPREMGKKDPTHAIMKPRVPTNLSVLKSISIPASRTKRTSLEV
jgi:hypothetical protein